MNIIIVGHGAIGSLWSYHLQQAGHNVSIAPKNIQELSAANSLQSLTLTDSPTITLNHARAIDFQCADLILVTVKSYQVKAAITPLLSVIPSEAIVVFMHNGMGAVENIASMLAGSPVVIATTTQAALKPDLYSVSHTGKGITQLGGFNELGRRCEFLKDVFEHALPQAQWLDDMQSALWSKLAINCAINPLTAIHQCQNGQLAESKYQTQLNSIVDELVLVMNAEGIEVTKEELKITINTVIKATAKNYSSMNQDIANNRTTEIDFITGHLLSVAKKHKIECPVNQQLYIDIKQLETSWS